MTHHVKLTDAAAVADKLAVARLRASLDINVTASDVDDVVGAASAADAKLASDADATARAVTAEVRTRLRRAVKAATSTADADAPADATADAIRASRAKRANGAKRPAASPTAPAPTV